MSLRAGVALCHWHSGGRQGLAARPPAVPDYNPPDCSPPSSFFPRNFFSKKKKEKKKVGARGGGGWGGLGLARGCSPEGAGDDGGRLASPPPHGGRGEGRGAIFFFVSFSSRWVFFSGGGRLENTELGLDSLH